MGGSVTFMIPETMPFMSRLRLIAAFDLRKVFVPDKDNVRLLVSIQPIRHRVALKPFIFPVD